MNMKRILPSIILLSLAFSAYAQNYQVDSKNSEMLRFGDYHEPSRKEIIIPRQVNGYNVYKADLHAHTVFSDGSVTPQFRVKEAWIEGLDIIAITDHIEYRPFEKTMSDYVSSRDKKNPDLNTSVELAQDAAEEWDIFIIPGTEITRDGRTVGHFNALFTTNNNKVYDKDPIQAMRNARKQGALIMHNHPGWVRKNIDYTEVEKVAYDEGLIDGVEVMNYNEFYPGIIDRVRERNLFISANTDVHESSTIDFNQKEYMRPMTLIFATERSENGIREALEAGRTLAFGFNTLCGSEQLLQDFFKASVIVRKVSGNAYMLTNETAVPYVLQSDGANPIHLDPFSTIRLEGTSVFKVLNMFCGKDAHPTVELSL
ncbi:MAG: histidinol-phosphatase [Bacteroidales bacterium]|nr:histidinol-phosphatase [Bacteroidales bacterium]